LFILKSFHKDWRKPLEGLGLALAGAKMVSLKIKKSMLFPMANLN